MRRVIDARTGIETQVPLTQEELDAAAAAAAAEAATRTAATEAAKDINNFDKRLKAVVLWIAPLVGKTPLQAKNEIKAILDGLP